MRGVRLVPWAGPVSQGGVGSEQGVTWALQASRCVTRKESAGRSWGEGRQRLQPSRNLRAAAEAAGPTSYTLLTMMQLDLQSHPERWGAGGGAQSSFSFSFSGTWVSQSQWGRTKACRGHLWFQSGGCR